MPWSMFNTVYLPLFRSSPSHTSQKYSVSEIRHLVVEDYPSNSSPSLRRHHSTSTISDHHPEVLGRPHGGKRVHMILTSETTDLIEAVGSNSLSSDIVDAERLEIPSTHRNGVIRNGGAGGGIGRKWASRNR